MINRFQLIRHVGQFQQASMPNNSTLLRLSLIYAENGRGKTTLSAILRSLAAGEALPIAERRRIPGANAPHVVIECSGTPQTAVFENGVWSRTFPDLMIFDDMFVDTNVHSGLTVASDHRQKMHELILGAQGVALNRRLQELVARIERHNTSLRNISASIPAAVRGMLSVDDFCALPFDPNIQQEIDTANRQLAAARDGQRVRTTPLLDPVNLPQIDVESIEALLGTTLRDMETAALEQVHRHLERTGRGAEGWIGEGMPRIHDNECPFCGQDLEASPLIPHYRAYFGEQYQGLRSAISQLSTQLTRTHSGDVIAGFERAIRTLTERVTFWSQYEELPNLAVDTAVISASWILARDAALASLNAKANTPLEPLQLPEQSRRHIEDFNHKVASLAVLRGNIAQTNTAIAVVKERAAGANMGALQADVIRLTATRERHTAAISVLCDQYLAEQNAKTHTEADRNTVKQQLDQYRATAFPALQQSINTYLQRFGAGFRLDQVASADTRGGPTCNYSVLINNTPVPVGGNPVDGVPSFKNTLSAGDRNTLALAFFFATLDADSRRANMTVVIDDPFSSLDEHRSLTTMQEVRKLAGEVEQVILLSHNKPFLCRIWETATNPKSAFQVGRDGTASTIVGWRVEDDCVTENDRRHELMRRYLSTNVTDSREVARALRPSLEAFMRVAYPADFRPGDLLGSFKNTCQQRIGSPNAILSRDQTSELGHLIEYANRFHHDTNLACDTLVINDAELQNFVQRTLAFARK